MTAPTHRGCVRFAQPLRVMASRISRLITTLQMRFRLKDLFNLRTIATRRRLGEFFGGGNEVLPIHTRLSSTTLLVLSVLLFAVGLPAIGMDARMDGRIDVRDVQRIALISASIQSPQFVGHGDANGDGNVNSVDVQATVNEILGLPSPLRLTGPTVLPLGLSFNQYQVRLPSAGGVRPHSWSYTGTLPSWLSLSVDGWLTGYPQGNSTSVLNLVLTDSASSQVTVSLTLPIGILNLPPVASNDSYTFVNLQTFQVSAPGVLANDSDPDNDPLTAVLVTPPAHGNLNLNPNGSFSYTTTQPLPLQDSFVYTAFDGLGHSAPAMVQLDLQFAVIPVAVDDDYVAQSGQSLSVGQGLLANDTIPQGIVTQAILHSQALHGTVTVNTNGSFTYLAIPGFTGEDEFMYRLEGNGHTSYAMVRVFVHMPGNASQPWLSSHMEQNPVQAGVNAEVIARVRSHSNNLPTTNQVLSVFVHPSPSTSIPMTLTGHTSDKVAVYSAIVPTNGWAFGLHEMTLTATLQGQIVLEDWVTVAVYQGAPIRVGASHQFADIASALSSSTATQGRGILVDPGSWTGLDNQALSLGTIMLASDKGLHRTKAIPSSTQFVSGMSAVGGYIVGFSIEPWNSNALTINDASTVYQCRISDSFLTGVGMNDTAGIKLNASNVTITECWLRDNTLGNGLEGSLNGAAIIMSGLNILLNRCCFFNNETKANAWCRGGAVHIHGGGQTPGQSTVIVDCLFSVNRSICGSWSFGGAISVYSAGNADILNCDFVGNQAIAGGQFVPESSSSGRAYGGAVAAAGFLTRIASCNFVSNQANGGSWVQGGAIHVSSYLTMHDCLIEYCETVGVASTWKRGGGIDCASGTFVLLESVIIRNCTALHGGGIISQGALVLDQCQIHSNTATSGAGIYLHLGSGLLSEHTTIRNNIGTTAVYLMGSPTSYPIYFRNTLIYGHTGSAFQCSSSGPQQLDLVNCTIAGNGPPMQGPLSLNLTNTIIWGNSSSIAANVTGTATNCCIQPGAPAWATSSANGNISVNPNFSTGPLGTFYLSSTSPCIDTGTPAIPAGLLDFTTTQVQETPDTGNPDMGYHYWISSQPQVSRATMTPYQLAIASGISVSGAIPNVPILKAP